MKVWRWSLGQIRIRLNQSTIRFTRAAWGEHFGPILAVDVPYCSLNLVFVLFNWGQKRTRGDARSDISQRLFPVGLTCLRVIQYLENIKAVILFLADSLSVSLLIILLVLDSLACVPPSVLPLRVPFTCFLVFLHPACFFVNERKRTFSLISLC